MATQKEAQGAVQDKMEGQCFSAGFGTPQASLRGAAGGVWVDGCLGFFVENVDKKKEDEKVLSTLWLLRETPVT